MFSFRDDSGQWNPKAQRPELWSLYNARVHKGENMRVFPLSNWTELDVWQYIRQEAIPLPELYFAHRARCRPPRRRAGAGDASDARRTPAIASRTSPCAFAPSATFPAPRRWNRMPRRWTTSSTKRRATRITERGATRLDDQANDAAMELRKRQGYF